MEEEDITEVMKRMVRDFARQRERRDVAYEYDRHEFGLWVASVKAPRSAMEAFESSSIVLLNSLTGIEDRSERTR